MQNSRFGLHAWRWTPGRRRRAASTRMRYGFIPVGFLFAFAILSGLPAEEFATPSRVAQGTARGQAAAAFVAPEHVNLVQWPGAKLTASSGDPTVLAERLERTPFGTGTAPTRDGRQWVQLELPDTQQQICRVRIVSAGMPGANAVSTAAKLQVWVGNDAEDPNDGVMVREVTDNKESVVDIAFTPVAGKVVRVELYGRTHYNLSGFAVFSRDPKAFHPDYPISDALSSGVTIHPVSGWWHGRNSRGAANLLSPYRLGHELLVDDQSVCALVSGEDATVRIDLPRPFRLAKIRLGCVAEGHEAVSQVRLAASLDDLSYRTIYDGKAPRNGIIELAAKEGGGLGVVRYLRLTLPRDPAQGLKGLNRLQLFGAPVSEVRAETPRRAGTLTVVDVPKGAALSAGVYDRENRLIRTLHAAETVPPGRRPVVWDGRDDFGRLAPPAEYRFRTLVTPVTCEALPAVGNTGEPPHGATKASKWVTGIAFDPAGNWYQTASWDEAGLSVRQYLADGSSGWSFNQNGSFAVAIDGRYVYVLLADIGGEKRGQRVSRLRIADGQFDGFPDAPKGYLTINPPADFEKPPAGKRNTTLEQEMWNVGVWGLGVDEQRLWVGNYRQNRVEIRDKKTGSMLSHFAVPKPIGLALDPDGNAWVVNRGNRVTCYDAAGKELRSIDGLESPFAVAVGGPEGDVYVTDHGRSQVLRYRRTNLKRVWARGGPGLPGPVGDDTFRWNRGSAIAVAPKGRYLVADPANQRLQAFEPDGELWRSFKADFAQPGPIVPAEIDPSILLSGGYQYRVDLKTGQWKFTHNWTPGDGAFSRGAAFLRRLANGRRYLYYINDSTAGPAAYAIESGERLRRSSLFGALWTGEDDNTDHQWKPRPFTWTDRNGDGRVSEGETTFAGGDLNYFHWHGWIDETGAFWIHDLKAKAIRRYPVDGFDEHDNPRYDWAKSDVVIPADRMEGFQATLVRPTPDGKEVFLIGTTSDTREHWKGAGLYHQGGFAIARHAADDGRRLSQFQLPVEMVSFAVDGRFVYAAANPDPQVVTILTLDGLVVARAIPVAAYGFTRGWMDTATPLTAFRQPGTDIHHLYTEDVAYSCLLHWRFKAPESALVRKEGTFNWPPPGSKGVDGDEK